MYTIMAVVALTTGISTAKLSPAPTWLNDYQIAQRRVTEAGKPMAVFVGSGQEGWGKVVRDGAIDPAVTKLLAEKYVCLYVDTETTSGRALAGMFQVANRALIISDRTGGSQAYSLSGTLTRAELVQTLEKYADTGKEFRSTETIVREAPPVVVRPVTVAQPVYQPQYYYQGALYRPTGQT
jgi:hypothetical protein